MEVDSQVRETVATVIVGAVLIHVSGAAAAAVFVVVVVVAVVAVVVLPEAFASFL